MERDSSTFMAARVIRSERYLLHAGPIDNILKMVGHCTHTVHPTSCVQCTAYTRGQIELFSTDGRRQYYKRSCRAGHFGVAALRCSSKSHFPTNLTVNKIYMSPKL